MVGITLENIREKRFAFCNEVLIKSGSEVVLCRKYWSAEHIAVPVVWRRHNAMHGDNALCLANCTTIQNTQDTVPIVVKWPLVSSLFQHYLVPVMILILEFLTLCAEISFLGDNRTHYTTSQSTVWYDTQLTILIVFRCRNYTDSFFSYVHLFSDIPSNDNAFSIWAWFASDRIGRVYVHSTNMADLIFFHKTLTFRTII